MIDAARPKIVNPQTVLLPASPVMMTFECELLVLAIIKVFTEAVGEMIGGLFHICGSCRRHCDRRSEIGDRR